MSSDPFEQIKSPNLAPNRVTLTGAQEKAWMETRAALLWSAPAFSNLLYSMMTDEEGRMAYFTDEVPIAATDDKHLFANPDTFFKHDLQERVFIAAHEVLHAALNHCGQFHMWRQRKHINYADGSSLPFDMEIMNVAADLVINDLLIESRIGKFNPQWLHDRGLAVGDDTITDAYRKVYKVTQGGKGAGKGSGSGSGTPGNCKGKRFDEHLQPGKGDGENPAQAQQDRNQSEWNTALAAAAQSARVQGKLPAALDRFFKKLFEPQVDWAEHIKTFFARKVGNNTSSWETLDEQLVIPGKRRPSIGAPGRQGWGAGTIIVATDTSGSITQAMMDAMMSETSGILEDMRPKRLILIQCDAKVHEVVELEGPEDLCGVKIKGGGGTDFRPVFELIAEEFGEPDALVFFTDGYGSFPSEVPAYPVVWGNITPDYKYPFGDVVFVPMPRG